MVLSTELKRMEKWNYLKLKNIPQKTLNQKKIGTKDFRSIKMKQIFARIYGNKYLPRIKNKEV